MISQKIGNKTRFIKLGRRFDFFDRLRAYYIDGRRLNERLEGKRLELEQAHQLRCAGYSKEMTVKMLIRKEVAKSQADAYKICNQAEILFGDVGAANKDGLRVILTENFLRLFKWSVHRGNIKEANRALQNVAKINMLMNGDNSINWNEIIIPVPIYTSDSKVLHNVPAIEDAEIITE
jgi:hypothetical protein